MGCIEIFGGRPLSLIHIYGNSIVSTLDVNIQQIVEKYITEFDAEYADGPSESAKGHGSKYTAVIVGNPNTGEIYAMATNHDFDLNNPCLLYTSRCV